MQSRRTNDEIFLKNLLFIHLISSIVYRNSTNKTKKKWNIVLLPRIYSSHLFELNTNNARFRPISFPRCARFAFRFHFIRRFEWFFFFFVRNVSVRLNHSLSLLLRLNQLFCYTLAFDICCLQYCEVRIVCQSQNVTSLCLRSYDVVVETKGTSNISLHKMHHLVGFSLENYL